MDRQNYPAWLFDEQGRMKADLPPLLDPVPDNALLPSPPGGAPRGEDLSGRIIGKILDSIGVDEMPNALGGWEVKPTKFPKNPHGAHKAPYGIMLWKKL